MAKRRRNQIVTRTSKYDSFSHILQYSKKGAAIKVTAAEADAEEIDNCLHRKNSKQKGKKKANVCNLGFFEYELLIKTRNNIISQKEKRKLKMERDRWNLRERNCVGWGGQS